jgi:predicted transcriptional regulator of viral defense system
MGRLPSGLARAEAVFRRRRGLLRTTDALRLGIHRDTLYTLRELGRIESLGRGVWYLVDHPLTGQLDLAAVALRYPRSVICLVSALQWHDLTTQLPREVQIAAPPGRVQPLTRYPPVRTFQFSPRTYAAGIERHAVAGVKVRVYSAAKTIADCFKFRRRVGMDVTVGALRDAWRRRLVTMDDLGRYARICRVERVMRPYLESLA